MLAISGISATGAMAKPPSGGGGTTTASTGGKASVVDYSQCQNLNAGEGCKKWGNGILNTSNSAYHEGDVTPQRLLLEIPAGAPLTHSVDIRYMTLKGSAHAYDHLARWDYSQSTANRCQGLTNCPTGTPSKVAMKSDPKSLPPSANSTITRDHELPQADREWVLYGGTITNVTTPTHSTVDEATGTSDYATVHVDFSVTSTSSKRYVQLLFGGHTAESVGPLGWGAGLGSGTINGGPYHIILDKVDGESVGSRDNQIQSSAILPPPPSFTEEKLVNGVSSYDAQPGEVVTYTIRVDNTGGSTGTHTFRDDFDDRLSPSSATWQPSGGSCVREKSGTNRYFDCTSPPIAPGTSATVSYTAQMPSTFTGSPGGSGCDPDEYPVLNRVLVAGAEVDRAVVCVDAPAEFTYDKEPRQQVVNAGDPVTYDIEVTNIGGSAGTFAFIDDFDDRLQPTTPTASGVGGTCTRETTATLGSYFSCVTSSIPPGGEVVFTYTAAMPSTFTGSGGGEGCASTQYPVVNDVLVTGSPTDHEVVCVNAAPAFTYDKSATTQTVQPGATVPYEIVVTNGGSAPGSHTFTDDYDPRIDPDAPDGCTKDPAASTFTCTTGEIAPGGTQVFQYTATMPLTYAGASGDDRCVEGEYPVINRVLVDGSEVDRAVVCVAAEPEFEVDKWPSTTATVHPGDEVTYTIVVSNTGAAAGADTFTDDYDPRIDPDPPNGCTKDPATSTFTCTTGEIAAGGTKTFTYTAVMSTAFEGHPDGDAGSCPGRFSILNSVRLTTGDADDAVVCVDAAPELQLVKEGSIATGTVVHEGDEITYTLTLTHTTSSTASAHEITVTDQLPEGVELVSCSDTCSANGSTVTWPAIATLAVGDTAVRTLTVRLTTDAIPGCEICNEATASYTFAGATTNVASNPWCNVVEPQPDNTGALASGEAIGATVAIGTTTAGPFSDVRTSTTNTIPSTDTETAASVSDAALTTDLLETMSSSLVTNDAAHQVSVSEVADLCVRDPLNPTECLVSADVVRAVATTEANGETATSSGAGSAVENLVVNGQAIDAPAGETTTVTLSQFGLNSYVAVNEVESTATTSGGFNQAELAVTMIHVHLTGVGGLLDIDPVDIVIARAEAHSRFAETYVCTPADDPEVDAHAFAVEMVTSATTRWGYVDIPSTGGDQSQALTSATAAPVIEATSAYTHADGSIAQPANAHGVAEVVGDTEAPACILRNAMTGTCAISARLLRAESATTATPPGPGSTGTVTIVDLSINGGAPFSPSVTTSTADVAPGLLVVVGEKVCDDGTSGPCVHGMTIRALRIVVTREVNPFGLAVGTQIIVSEAYSRVD